MAYSSTHCCNAQLAGSQYKFSIIIIIIIIFIIIIII